MDYDVEMDDVHDRTEVHIPAVYTEDIITGEEQEPGEVDDVGDENHRSAGPDESTVVPYKIHINGLDTFKPDDVKAYVAEHYSGGRFERIEWIDDSSANLIFKSESNAQEALVALSSAEMAHASQLPPRESIPAKGFAAKPDSLLQVRFALASDKKTANAAARSRFYLLHPEFDPEERRRRGEMERRYRDRDGGYLRQRRRGGRRSQYDYDDEEKTFDVSLYDDDEDTRAKRASRQPRSRRDSVSTRSSESDQVRQQADRRNRDRELLPGWKARGGPSRDRSASPVRTRDRDDDAMDRDEDFRTAASMRNREKARAIKERLNLENSNRELFPDKAGRLKSTKELFPAKVGAPAGGVAQMDQVDDSTILSSAIAKLADRITPRESSNAFSIRGMASTRGSDQGFAIKGTGANVKELFPDRFGNAGKELFADRAGGPRVPRVTRQARQKAQDLFY